MSIYWQSDIKELMKLYGQEVKDRPEIPNEKTVELRKSLIEEEFLELMDGLGYYLAEDEISPNEPMPWRKKFSLEHPIDIVKVADGIVDSIVVLIGCACSFGIDIPPVWDLIHKNNLTKASGPVREDGKRLKGPDWCAPKIKEELERQSMEDEK